MRIGDVIGRVVLNQADPQMKGGRFVIVQPLNLDNLSGAAPPSIEPVVAYDELGAGDGTRVGIAEGREAAMPFHPTPVALDVYVGCILDHVVIEGTPPKRKKD